MKTNTLFLGAMVNILLGSLLIISFDACKTSEEVTPEVTADFNPSEYYIAGTSKETIVGKSFTAPYAITLKTDKSATLHRFTGNKAGSYHYDNGLLTIKFADDGNLLCTIVNEKIIRSESTIIEAGDAWSNASLQKRPANNALLGRKYSAKLVGSSSITSSGLLSVPVDWQTTFCVFDAQAEKFRISKGGPSPSTTYPYILHETNASISVVRASDKSNERDFAVLIDDKLLLLQERRTNGTQDFWFARMQLTN